MTLKATGLGSKKQHDLIIDDLINGKILTCSFCNDKFDLKFSQALGSFRDFPVRSVIQSEQSEKIVRGKG